MANFYYPQLFPSGKDVELCFPERESIDEVNEEIAEQSERYSGSYAGTFYPFKCTLQQAMDMFWRVKKINFSFSIFDDYGNGASQTIESISPAIIEEFDEPLNEVDSMKKRICGAPEYLSYEGKFTRTSDSLPPSVQINKNVINWFSRGSSFDGIGEIFNGATLPNSGIYNILRGVKIYKNDGSPKSNPKNYWYYPSIAFGSGLYRIAWSTFFPHYTLDFPLGTARSFTGQKKTINVDFGNFSFPLDIYEILEEYPCPDEDGNITTCIFGAGSVVDFSNWNVELWSRPS